MLFRRHPVVMRKGLLALLVLLLVGMVPVTIWPTNLQLLWGIPIALLLGGFVLFYFWIGWYFSVFIVTNQRLVQISQKGLFHRSFVDIGLDKIQNVNYQIAGIQETLLGFGTILVQTYVGDMMIDKVHHPQDVQEEIVSIIKELGYESPVPAQIIQENQTTSQQEADAEE